MSHTLKLTTTPLPEKMKSGIAKPSADSRAYCFETVIGGTLFTSAWFYGTRDEAREHYKKKDGAAVGKIKVRVK
jgi:hypothetical protein